MQFFNTHIDPLAVSHLQDVFEDNFVGEGHMVKKFEDGLASTLGILNPVAVNSGTAALHLALIAAGVEEGDEVLLPAQTFVATGLVILMQKAKPVFVDINPYTGNMDPNKLQSKITDKTKAIMPVHWGGTPCELTAINRIADFAGLTVIEDAAHALGALYRGKPVGTISDYAAFSFQAIKHMTTGDGGALCCRDVEKANEVRRRRWFGIDRANTQPSELGDRGYDITELGYKYHMNNIAAAIGVGNLEHFTKRLQARRNIADFYIEQLDGIEGLELMRPDIHGSKSAYWLFPVLVERRNHFVKKMREARIPVSVVDRRIDRYSIFGGITPNLKGQEYFEEHQIHLPIHDGLSSQDIELIVNVIKKGW